MAKKKGSGEMDDNYDFEDLEDLEGGLDLGDMDSIDTDRNPSMSNIASELSKEASKGLLDSLVKETVKKSLPTEYDTYSSDVLDYANLGREMFDSSKSRVERSMFKLGREVKKILPFQSKMLNNFLEKYKSENERAQEASEEAMREAGIQSNLSSIFDKQLEVQTAIEARRDAKEEVKAKHDLVTTKLQANILSSIDKNTAQQTAFTMQVSKEYYRRSLELQYKSYFIQADMLKTMKDYYKGFSVQFDSITKNTGLPEFVKLTNTERLSEIARDKITESIYKRMFSESDYIQKVKTKALSYVNTKVDEKLQGIDSFSDQLEMMSSATGGAGGMARMLGSVFSGMGGSVIGEKIASRISPKIKERIKDNRFINAGASQLSLLGSSPTTFFANLRNSISKKQEQFEGENTPGEWLGNKVLGGFNDLLSVTTPESMNFSVKKDSILDHGKPAIYTNKTDRAITEVIPMYLARILQQNTDLTTMYGQVNKGRYSTTGSSELVYNYDERKLGTIAELRDHVQSNILDKKDTKARTTSIAGLMLKSSRTNLSKDKKTNKNELSVLGSKKAETLLASYFDKASKSGVDMNYSTLVESALDETRTPKQLKEILDANPDLRTVLTALKKGSDEQTTSYVDRSMSDLDSLYPTGALIELFKQVSKISGSKTFNLMDKKTAEPISKALTMFQMKKGNDFLPEDMVSGKAFNYFNKNDFTADVKRHLGIFTSELRKILNTGDITSISAVTALVGIVNTSIRRAYELDPKTFQTLRDYSPLLGDTGTLTNENLIERKLMRSTENSDSYVDTSDLRSIIRPSKIQVEQDKADVLNKVLGSSIFKGVSEFTKDIKEAGSDPRKLLSVTISHTKKASEAITAKSKETYKKASSKLDEVNDAFKKLTDAKSKEAITVLKNKMHEYANSIDSLIEADNVAMNEKITALNDLKSKLSEISTDERSPASIDREIRLTTSYYKDKIKVLTEVKSTLLQQHSRIQQVEQNMEGKSVTDVIKEVKDIVSNNLDKLRTLMNKAKAAEEKAEAVVS